MLMSEDNDGYITTSPNKADVKTLQGRINALMTSNEVYIDQLAKLMQEREMLCSIINSLVIDGAGPEIVPDWVWEQDDG